MPLKVKFMAAVGLQLLVLVGLIGSRQWTLMTGRPVLLETVPVDPRSLFRGDYVILRYKISTLDPEIIPPDEETPRRGQTVYVTLCPQGRYWEAAAASRRRPPVGPEEVVIKGRWRGGHRVQYGIEQYFVPEGQGREIERLRGRRADGAAQLAVEVAVDRAGRAAIKRLIYEDPSGG